MADESGFSLTNTFKKVAKHMFSPTMIFMMAVMALPAITMAAPAGAATLGDWGVALFDHYLNMFTAPFTEAGTIGDMVGNAANGDFAAHSYEMGGAHAMHGAHAAGAGEMAGHTVGTQMDYSQAGQFQANEASQLWDVPPDQHKNMMLSHPR